LLFKLGIILTASSPLGHSYTQEIRHPDVYVSVFTPILRLKGRVLR
jgi:hypothetical protein